MSDLKRYFIQNDISKDNYLTVQGAQYNHMVNVMRHRTGDRVIILNGDGYDYTAEIKEIGKHGAQLYIIDKEVNERKLRLNLKVYCGLLKGEGSEYQAVKLSELGVSEFTPFISENCVVKSGSGKAERLMRVAEESSKQCKRAVPIKVNEILTYDDALNAANSCGIKVIAYELENNNTLKEILKDINKQTSAALFIGPEGGFTLEEIRRAESSGFTAVTLGKTILKADTAAIAAASAILYEAGEWSR